MKLQTVSSPLHMCVYRLATSRYMLCLAEVLMFPCGGHVLERLSTLKWLGDEEEMARSEGKTKGVLLALNSSRIAPWKSNYPRNLGCKDPFSKNLVGATAGPGASKLRREGIVLLFGSYVM